MKIEITKEKLLDAVSRAERISVKNSTLPVLSCVFLEGGGGKLIIRATNLDLGLEIIIPAKTNSSGSVAIPGGILSGFLSNIQGDRNIILEEVGGNLSVSAGNTNSLIKCQPADDFPALPKISKGKTVKIPTHDLLKGLRSVWWSSAVTSIKPELSSVYLYTENGNLVFVATDSFRLAEKKVQIRQPFDLGNILIPFKNTAEIIRILDGVEGNITITVGSAQILFSFDDNYIVSRTIEGTFPDYRQIIPKEVKTEAMILKQDLIQALKIANIFTDSFHQVSLHIIPGEKIFEVKTKSAEIGENENKLEAAISGEDLSINFNYRYLSDCFQSIDSDSVTLSFGGIGKPLVVRGVSDPSFLYLVMPMNK